MLFSTFILLVLANNLSISVSSLIEDNNGYILYCPCMGRFGNQADHFLGAFAFSKALNRTLVLPPWIEYRYGEPRSIQVPFDTYFHVDTLNEYHRTITMEQFMKSLAPKIWPAKERISFCYMARTGQSAESCNAKEGNPFGPFWDTFEVEFVKSEFYGPLNYDILRPGILQKWETKYPPKKWPVLAFTGAPGSFPVQAENLHIHQYLKWSDTISSQAHDYIRSTMNGGGFVGIHLRNGADWVRACQHVAESPRLFSAPQCVGYQNEKGSLTPSMCFPTKQDIVRQLKRVIKQVKEVKHIFVASDANHMLSELQEALKRSNVTIHRLQPSNSHLDLAILARANHFIGNCISSFTAFVKRERDSTGLPSSFWAFPPHKSARHDEL